MIKIHSFSHRWLTFALALMLGLGLGFAPQALAEPGDVCQNAQGVQVDQLCDIGAGELCVEGVCVYVPLEEGGTGLSLPGPGGEVKISSSIVQDRTLGELVILVVNYFIGFLGIVATVMFIYAGVLWVVSAGNEDLVSKAKSIMTYASLGILVIILSYTIVRFLTNAAGSDTPGSLGEQGGEGYQCAISSDCPADHYCFQGQCQNSVKIACQDSSECSENGQCSPLGFCFNPDAGSGFSCPNDGSCNLGFVCNLGTNKCDLAGVGQGGGILGGNTQGQSEEALQGMDALMKGMEGGVDQLNEDIQDLPEQFQQEVIELLGGGGVKEKKASLSTLMEGAQDSATLNLLEKILGYLERLEDLQAGLEELQQIMPESLKTLEASEKAEGSLQEAVDDPRSSIKYRRFEEDYKDLKQIIRQFPVVQSKIRATPGEGSVPLTVTFNGLDSLDPTGGTISDYKWSYLDNKGKLISLGNDPVAVHTFTEPNTYAVRLQVSTAQTDEAGHKMATDGVSVVRVKVNPPTSKVEFKINGKKVGDVHHITLKEAKTGLSFDPSGTTAAFGRTVEHYEWFFGDATSEIRDTPSTVLHNYQAAGEYLVTLKIRDNAAIEDRRVVKLILKPLASDAQVSPAQGDVTTQFTFKGSGSRSDSGAISQYEWQITDPNDTVVATFQEPEVRYRFEKPGEYQVALVVTDSMGQSDRSVQAITVLSRSPVAHFSYRTPENHQPNTFEFDAGKSYDPDPEDQLTYSWDFDGDGGFEVVDGKDLRVNHTYRQTGTYKVVLQVQDSFGQRHQYEESLTVESTLGGEILLDQKSFRVAEEVTFKSMSAGAVAYLWDFGDGQTVNTEASSLTHAYTEKGKYTVTLHFFDRKDNSNTHALTVLVGDQDTPLALARATVDQYSPPVTQDACGAGKPAMTVRRNDRVMLSGADSVNRDGTSRLLDYTWTLPEGVQNTSREFAYRFTQLTADPCTPVTLVVRDQLSGQVSQQDILYFKVLNEPPALVDFIVESLSEELVTPTKVRLQAVNPTDIDGQIKQYRWWYFVEGNEDQKLGVHSTPTPETEMILTAQGQPGVKNPYVFVVEITDNDGGVYNSMSDYGTVSRLEITNGPNLSPVAEFVVDKTTIAAGDTISFISKSYDPQGETLPSNAFRWDFNGDGLFDDTTSGPQLNQLFTTPGQFAVRLNVSYRGLSSSVTHVINVQPTNQFPQAAFSYSVSGNIVKFNAIYSRSHPGIKLVPLRYEWDFNTQEDADGNGVSDDDVQATEMDPSFTYPQRGRYSVSLKILDNTGGVGVVLRQVNLNLTPEQWEQNLEWTLQVRSPHRPLTQLLLKASPASLQVGESSEIIATVENADQTPYKGDVFFEIIEGSGELTPNPAQGSVAQESEARGIFTATAPGPIRLRIRATQTFHGDLSEDIVLRVN